MQAVIDATEFLLNINLQLQEVVSTDHRKGAVWPQGEENMYILFHFNSVCTEQKIPEEVQLSFSFCEGQKVKKSQSTRSRQKPRDAWTFILSPCPLVIYHPLQKNKFPPFLKKNKQELILAGLLNPTSANETEVTE